VGLIDSRDMIHAQDYEAAAEYFEDRAKKVSGEPDRMARFLAVAAKYRAKARQAKQQNAPDNKAEMEKTAAMWDKMARSIEAAQASSPVEKLLAKASTLRTETDELGR
jgi:hypothetical protein